MTSENTTNREDDCHQTTVDDSMYQVPWVQRPFAQVQDALSHNSGWLGLDASKPQRILDYGCGNGTVSSGHGANQGTGGVDWVQALLTTFPLAVFRGIDILDTQVKLYNEIASKLLGPDHRYRMSAIQGDLHEPHKTPSLDDPEWFGFDSLVTSFVLHHVDDPIRTLELLKARIRSGGTLVVVDWLKEEVPDKGMDKETAAVAQGVPQNQAREGSKKYNPADMLPVPMGKVWPGFSLQDIREDYEAAGLTDVDVRIWPDKIELPQMATFGGRSTLYISKAIVP